VTSCTQPPQDEGCRYAEAAADVAVKRTFAILGVDVDDPKDVEEFRKDLRFGQDMRRARDKGALVFVGVVCTAAAYALFAGVLEKIGGAIK
jgi:hypothetical protein